MDVEEEEDVVVAWRSAASHSAEAFLPLCDDESYMPSAAAPEFVSDASRRRRHLAAVTRIETTSQPVSSRDVKSEVASYPLQKKKKVTRQPLKKKEATKIVCSWACAKPAGGTVSFRPAFFVGSPGKHEAAAPTKSRRKKNAALPVELEIVRRKRVVATKLASGEYPFDKRHRLDDPRPKRFVDLSLVQRHSSVAIAWDHSTLHFVIVIFSDDRLRNDVLRVYDPLVLPLPPTEHPDLAAITHVILDAGLSEAYPDAYLPALDPVPPDSLSIDLVAKAAAAATLASKEIARPGTSRAAILDSLLNHAPCPLTIAKQPQRRSSQR